MFAHRAAFDRAGLSDLHLYQRPPQCPISTSRQPVFPGIWLLWPSCIALSKVVYNVQDETALCARAAPCDWRMTSSIVADRNVNNNVSYIKKALDYII